jgi:N-acetylmuramoyl-L-alanine amidase
MKDLKYLIIHCTATIDGKEISSNTIRKWHLSKPPLGRGWKQVGYSDMIHLDGIIENLVKHNDNNYVEPWEITNGVAGINSVSRHIVYVGGLDAKGRPFDTRTNEQTESLRQYVLNIISKNPNILVAGHNQFAAKACPSFNVPIWLKSIGVEDKNIYKKK